MDAYELLGSFDDNGVLGALTGVSQAEAERLHRVAHQEASAALAQALEQARGSLASVRLDVSRLSGVNCGDAWIAQPSGGVRRELDRFPEVEELLLSPAAPAEGSPELAEIRPLLMRMAYNGLWSPSGTNWQPIRAVELGAFDLQELGHTGRAGLLVLARSRYESLLGDVARLSGIEPEARAEWIDLGIWLQVAWLTARAHGVGLTEHPFERQPAQAARVSGLLARREGPLAQALADSVARGDHWPAALLLPGAGSGLALDPAQPGGLRRSLFDTLIEARATQRVASPAGDLPPEFLQELWQTARAGADLRLAIFSARDEVPRSIGAAMHRRVGGDEGGSGLAAASLDSIQRYLRAIPDLPEAVRAWVMGEATLEPPLPVAALPVHLRTKLLEAQTFVERGGLLADGRGRLLSPSRLVKLLRLIARGFGRFFLEFQNTHPLLGVLLVPSGGNDRAQERAWLHAGRAVATMTIQSRARGLVSIIKSGPVEIAREDIRALVAAHAHDADVRRGALSGALAPLLTFQVGLPLGPRESVCGGKPEEHDGLAERLLDRRAPRARLSEHYLPAPDREA